MKEDMDESTLLPGGLDDRGFLKHIARKKGLWGICLMQINETRQEDDSS